MYAGLKEYSNISLILAAETIKGNGPTEIICCILIVTGGMLMLTRLVTILVACLHALSSSAGTQ